MSYLPHATPQTATDTGLLHLPHSTLCATCAVLSFLPHTTILVTRTCYTCHTQGHNTSYNMYLSSYLPHRTPQTATSLCHTCHIQHLLSQESVTCNTSYHYIVYMLHITFSCNTCCHCYTQHLQYTSVSVMHNTVCHTLHLLQHIPVSNYTSCDTYVCHRDCGIDQGLC